MAETATVAVLFCDLVASTERQSRLGDDAADDFRRRFFAAVRSPLKASGGTEIKSLGDGIMATFESTTGALLCAVAMHDAVADLDPDDPVLLRIGISVGEVGHEDDDWFGTPVVEAARLCAVAQAGSTFATAVVRSVVGSRGTRLRFTDMGAMQLKGLPAPIPVVAVDAVDRPSPVVAPVAAAKVVPTTTTIEEIATTTSWPRRRRGVLVAAVVAVFAVALGSAWVIGAADDDSTADGQDVESSTPTTAAVTRPADYKPSFRTVDCTKQTKADVPDAECGQLIVPEVRSKPLGRKIHIDVTRAPATDGATEPPVLLVDVNEQLGTSPLREHADVYALTLRGFSQFDEPRLDCPGLKQVWRDTLRLAPDDPRSIDQRQTAARSCADDLRAAGVQLEGYQMAEVADDLRDLVLVKRLGTVSVATSGFSTPAAVLFARTNRGSIDSLLLTNPTPPGKSAFANPTLNLSKEFGVVAALCADDEACTARFGDLGQEFLKRVDEFNAAPRLVPTTPLSSDDTPVDVLLDGRRMGAALAAALKASEQVSLVPSAIAREGISDDLLAAAAISDDLLFFGGEAASSGAVLSFMCSYDDRVNRTSEVSDSELAQFAGANNPALQPLSAAWDVPDVFDRVSQPLSGDLPVLLVEGGLSAAGVNAWSELMAANLPNATVLRLPTLSEDVSYVQPPCLRAIRRAFHARPDAKLSVSACEGASPPIEFVGL